MKTYHDGNQDVIADFMNHPFIWFTASNTDEEVLPYYQEFGLQDYFYLIDFVRFMALRLNTIPADDWDTLERGAQGLQDAVQWVNDWHQSLTDELQLRDEAIRTATRAAEEVAYWDFLESHAYEDNWFDLHVVEVPCIIGWAKVAAKLAVDERTLNDTIFYRTWIQPTLETPMADKLAK
ncbi:TENA/THI-4/PQQC family [Microdochium nivale]|nr:TENA/THI-4/PQQC family [Microdochium nivale]